VESAGELADTIVGWGQTKPETAIPKPAKLNFVKTPASGRERALAGLVSISTKLGRGGSWVWGWFYEAGGRRGGGDSGGFELYDSGISFICFQSVIKLMTAVFLYIFKFSTTVEYQQQQLDLPEARSWEAPDQGPSGNKAAWTVHHNTIQISPGWVTLLQL
jgi:hypothetical protein